MRLLAATLTPLLMLQTATLNAQEKPLPDRTDFLIEFQVKRPGIYRLMGRSDEPRLLSQYTYKDNVKEITLDSKGQQKKTQRQVFEYIPTRLTGYIYERQTMKDGVPLNADELARQDKKNDESVAKSEANWKKQSEANRKGAEERRRKFIEKDLPKLLDKRGLKGEERKIEEEKSIKAYDQGAAGVPNAPRRMEDSSVLQASDFQLVGREVLDGQSVIVLTFKPKKAYKGGGDFEKVLQHVAGRIWVSEEDYAMMKIEVEVRDTISFALGFLAKVQPGSHAVFEWRKFNNEVWLPYREDFTVNLRILLLKGMHHREIHEYSDYKKYVVNTELKFEGQKVGQ